MLLFTLRARSRQNEQSIKRTLSEVVTNTYEYLRILTISDINKPVEKLPIRSCLHLNHAPKTDCYTSNYFFNTN